MEGLGDRVGCCSTLFSGHGIALAPMNSKQLWLSDKTCTRLDPATFHHETGKDS